jgi:hypothetical protein
MFGYEEELMDRIDNQKETIRMQAELLDLYETQVADLTMMSKIELGYDVISEIKRLKSYIEFNINKPIN